MKIKIIGDFIFLSEESQQALNKIGEVEKVDIHPTEETLIELCGDADVLITWGKPTARLISSCKNLKFIGYMFTGYDAIVSDQELVKALKESNVAISYAPGYAKEGVSDYAISALLAGIRKLVPAIINNRKSNYSEKFYNYMGGSISDSTIGIIGMGNIGTSVAEKLNALGANIISYTKNPQNKKLKVNVEFLALEEVFSRADHIVITAELNKETEGMITKELLLRLSENAVVVNAARGKIIKLEQLPEVLIKRKDIQFFLDEIEVEDNLLSQIVANPNVFITPHFAAIAMPTMLHCTDIITKNLISFLNGREYNKIPLE